LLKRQILIRKYYLGRKEGVPEESTDAVKLGYQELVNDFYTAKV